MLKALLLCALLALVTLTPRAETDAAPAPRPIPWNCDTWAAFAHEDRTTQILESLAANRGKALYCGVDQSETFTKAETWNAGKDRNERDDTVYFGEEGQFRGFIAAQEGYLTDGESGVTGVSIDRIFEFPREQKTRRRVTRRSIGGEITSCGVGEDGSPIIHDNNPSACAYKGPFQTAEADAIDEYYGMYVARPTEEDWQSWSQLAADAECSGGRVSKLQPASQQTVYAVSGEYNSNPGFFGVAKGE